MTSRTITHVCVIFTVIKREWLEIPGVVLYIELRGVTVAVCQAALFVDTPAQSSKQCCLRRLHNLIRTQCGFPDQQQSGGQSGDGLDQGQRWVYMMRHVHDGRT